MSEAILASLRSSIEFSRIIRTSLLSSIHDSTAQRSRPRTWDQEGALKHHTELAILDKCCAQSSLAYTRLPPVFQKVAQRAFSSKNARVVVIAHQMCSALTTAALSPVAPTRLPSPVYQPIMHTTFSPKNGLTRPTGGGTPVGDSQSRKCCAQSSCFRQCQLTATGLPAKLSHILAKNGVAGPRGGTIVLLIALQICST